MKKTFFCLCEFWAVKNFKKSVSELFLSGLRGALNYSNTFRIVFRIFFCVFQIVFCVDETIFGGSFVLLMCRPKQLLSVIAFCDCFLQFPFFSLIQEVLAVWGCFCHPPNGSVDGAAMGSSLLWGVFLAFCKTWERKKPPSYWILDLLRKMRKLQL